MPLLIKKALQFQSLALKQTKKNHLISMLENAEYAGHWFIKASCHTRYITQGIQMLSSIDIQYDV